MSPMNDNHQDISLLIPNILTGFIDIVKSGVPSILILQYLISPQWISFSQDYIQYLIMSGWFTEIIIISTYFYSVMCNNFALAPTVKMALLGVYIMSRELIVTLVMYPCLTLNCIWSYDDVCYRIMLYVFLIIRVMYTTVPLCITALCGVKPYIVNGVPDHKLINSEGFYMIGYGSIYSCLMYLCPERGDLIAVTVICMMVDQTMKRRSLNGRTGSILVV